MPGQTTKRGPKHEVFGYKDAKDPIKISTKMMDQVYIGNCENSKIVITTKVNQVLIENCINATIECDGNVIGTLSLIRSKKCTVVPKVGVGSVDISAAHNNTFILNHETLSNTKVVSCGATGTILKYFLQDDEKKFTLFEELETCFNARTLEAKTAVAEFNRPKSKTVNEITTGQNNQEIIKISAKNTSHKISTCKKSGFEVDNPKTLVLEDLKSCKIKITGAVETIEAYNCSSTNIHLNSDTMSKTTLFTFGCDCTNVGYTVGSGNSEEEKEVPLPEQLETCFSENLEMIPGIIDHSQG